MKIAPRYGTDPAVRLDVTPEAIREPLLRQRRRLADVLSALSPDGWATPSRCEGWSVQDVVAHLVSTDQFWAYSIACGLSAKPSRVLADFDPRATPATIVDGVRGTPPEDTLQEYVTATEALCAGVEALEGDAWHVLAEAPVGHVALSAVLHHALWDGWIHERDITEPLGLTPIEEHDEIEACLRYAIALSPAFTLQEPGGPSGAVAVVTTDPALTITATVHDGHVVVATGEPPADALVLRGDAVELLQALSVRRPLPCEVPDEHQWLVGGLAAVFEPEPSS